MIKRRDRLQTLYFDLGLVHKAERDLQPWENGLATYARPVSPSLRPSHSSIPTVQASAAGTRYLSLDTAPEEDYRPQFRMERILEHFGNTTKPQPPEPRPRETYHDELQRVYSKRGQEVIEAKDLVENAGWRNPDGSVIHWLQACSFSFGPGSDWAPTPQEVVDGFAAAHLEADRELIQRESDAVIALHILETSPTGLPELDDIIAGYIAG